MPSSITLCRRHHHRREIEPATPAMVPPLLSFFRHDQPQRRAKSCRVYGAQQQQPHRRTARPAAVATSFSGQDPPFSLSSSRRRRAMPFAPSPALTEPHEGVKDDIRW
ncbi:uncharacterized protein LOC107873259 [Capsicum annuum]|uniref:uncharacterized protein LOC107873259 n=1 Tax=Capsicum annuum TaxID=4072 RepID=UPI0007BF0FA7|nr:uncharacterized protein LOC107873259 [Capsicum annuum]